MIYSTPQFSQTYPGIFFKPGQLSFFMYFQIPHHRPPTPHLTTKEQIFWSLLPPNPHPSTADFLAPYNSWKEFMFQQLFSRLWPTLIYSDSLFVYINIKSPFLGIPQLPPLLPVFCTQLVSIKMVFVPSIFSSIGSWGPVALSSPHTGVWRALWFSYSVCTVYSKWCMYIYCIIYVYI